MEIKNMTLEQVNERISELAEVALDTEKRSALSIEAMDAMIAEKAELESRKAELEAEYRSNLDEVEKRKKMLDDIATGKTDLPIIQKKEEIKMEVNHAEVYRSAWLKRAKGEMLSEIEQRTYDNEINLGDAAAAVPEFTQNEIIRKIKMLAPLLNEVTLLSVNGNVKFAVEGTIADGALHAENTAITPATDSIATVSLTGFEMTKLIRISAAVKSMSIGAFEAWIVDQLSEALARIIEHYLIKGTGDNQPKGVDALTYVNGASGVQWSANSKPSAAELIALVGLLKGGYHKNAKFLINHSTFWNHIFALRDDSKFPIVREDGDGWRLLGRPVLFSDYVTDNDIFFGDFKKVVANLGERVQVESERNLQYNAYDYLGSALFDSDIALAEAFVKGAAAL